MPLNPLPLVLVVLAFVMVFMAGRYSSAFQSGERKSPDVAWKSSMVSLLVGVLAVVAALLLFPQRSVTTKLPSKAGPTASQLPPGKYRHVADEPYGVYEPVSVARDKAGDAHCLLANDLGPIPIGSEFVVLDDGELMLAKTVEKKEESKPTPTAKVSAEEKKSVASEFKSEQPAAQFSPAPPSQAKETPAQSSAPAASSSLPATIANPGFSGATVGESKPKPAVKRKLPHRDPNSKLEKDLREQFCEEHPADSLCKH